MFGSSFASFTRVLVDFLYADRVNEYSYKVRNFIPCLSRLKCTMTVRLFFNASIADLLISVPLKFYYFASLVTGLAAISTKSRELFFFFFWMVVLIDARSSSAKRTIFSQS